MDDNKRLGIFIIGTALIILIAAAIFMFIFNKRQNEGNQATTTPLEIVNPDALREKTLGQENKVDYVFDPTVEANRALNSEDLRKMALSFAERFGSYSNQANYGNISDLKVFMTPAMQDWADDYVVQLKKQNNGNTDYYGITTVAISGVVNNFDDTAGQAEILVSTQRKEVVGSAEAKVFNQDVLINFEKIKGEWKTKSAAWQK